MELEIKKLAGRYPCYSLFDRNKLFCRTDNFDIAKLIQEKFSTHIPDRPKRKQLSIEDVHGMILNKTGVALRINLSQKREIIEIRFIYCKIAHDEGHTLDQIGDYIQRNHASVIWR